VPVESHAWQSVVLLPPHAVLQQKPSTHVLLFAHWASRLQTPPGGSTAAHWFEPLQKKPEGQSVSTPHAPWHAVSAALHGVPAPQFDEIGPGQVAVPLQNSCAIAFAFGGAPEQVGARHTTLPVATGVWHLPPLQTSNVHTLPSLEHPVLSESGVNTHPFEVSHESVVHSSPSLQVMVAPL
jgi:hypothetical protein